MNVMRAVSICNCSIFSFIDVRLAGSYSYIDFYYLAHIFIVGCALTFASKAKFEIEAKISFRLEAKKSLISHDSLRYETPKI